MSVATTVETKESNGAASTPASFDVVIDADERFTQSVTFPGEAVAAITIDEPPPSGAGAGPNPARVLGAAVGSCLTASLVFCLRKARIAVNGIRTRVRGTLARNDRGRLRIASFEVVLQPVVAAADHARVRRCAAVFEDYCVVTASVRRGIDVIVRVDPICPPQTPTRLGANP